MPHSRDFARNFSAHLLLLAIIFFTASCGLVGGPKPVLDNPIELQIDKPGDYSHVAWINNETIVFVFRPPESDGALEYYLYQYDLTDKSWSDITPPLVDACKAGRSLYVQRLPDKSLGFSYLCTLPEGFQKGLLFTWDIENDPSPVVWADYDPLFQSIGFSFSPDMVEVIQGTLGFEVYSVKQAQRPVRILDDFFRVTYPAWSPDGQLIAFLGVPLPENIGTPFSADAEGFRAPYNVYLMKPDQSDKRSILEGVVFAGQLKWSPGGRFLTFYGEYQGADGIWALDPKTSKMTLLISQYTFYDWSPDGTQIIIEQPIETESTILKQTKPAIYALPTELQDTP